ncbi:MAG: copper chaperone PCu(A)C [Pseudomonas sp.]|jgi:copper(I)-binding protein|nr:copper chaperone PCu(A)C [Pseudomonas sp.]MDD2222605.1 copper chaperone PCu(A)C [Pseudomonas sp.]MDY0415540.1 copper chaperone PCu(A)C [Pseudomonas sp.]NLO53836.1 copper chaperone PCu(A)C [Gammaproteobacteria bacterium]
MRLTALTASLFALSITAALPSYAEQEHQHATHSTEASHNTLNVHTAWSRELPPTAPVGAAFMSIDNPSDQADRLLGASSSIAAISELHAHIHQGDVMRMVKVDAIDVPAQGTLILEPGGYHIMLIDLKKPLIAGEQLPLTLQFEHAGKVDVIVDIKSSDAGTSAASPAMDHSEHSNH